MPRAKPHEIDLHGLNIAQALARFTAAYNDAAASARGTRLVVIHGWNPSDFRHSIAAALHRLLKNRVIDYEYPYEGNNGRTLVHTGALLNEHRRAVASPKNIRPSKQSGPLRGGI